MLSADWREERELGPVDVWQECNKALWQRRINLVLTTRSVERARAFRSMATERSGRPFLRCFRMGRGVASA